ncbi:MAG: hypothetical protein IIA70_09260 [Proteobacteria bacterium]|nr:hypothetical protein [Pseudomonadota bacterium]
MKEQKDLSPLMKRLTDHFDDKPIREIEINQWPEADGAPLIVYVKPITVREKSQFLMDVRKIGELQAFVNLIVVKALDAQGKNLFTISDKPNLLTRTDADVLMDLGLDISYGAPVEKGATLAEK